MYLKQMNKKKMSDTKVRLASVVLDNFMNVAHGKLLLNTAESVVNPSILGLYGQNGSGKTALIRALSLLKTLLTEKPLKEQWADYICVASDSARLQFEFHWVEDIETQEVTRIFYEIVLRRKKEGGKAAILIGETGKTDTLSIQSEKLWLVASPKGNKEWQTRFILDTTVINQPFGPTEVYEQFIGQSADDRNALMVTKQLALERRTSFVFSDGLQTILDKKFKEERERALHSADLLVILLRLQNYGLHELFVIESSESSLVSRNTLPMQLKVDASEKHASVHGLLLLPLDESFTAVPKLMTVVREIIGQINIVLVQLVPGLTIELKALGKELGSDGETLERAQLVSHKNSRDIALKYESDGIKKIIAVLHLLICFYNQRSVTVAIDELDSGVFEYLLGELLKVLSQGGRGQLIFTSHNLRALEILEPSCVAFTTADPENRYVTCQSDGETENLRDVYYRHLILGTDETQRLYEPTNAGRIAFAMREAGQKYG